MRTPMKMTTLAASFLLTTATLLPAQTTQGTAQGGAQTQSNIAPPSAAGQTAGAANWTTDQLITSTVHQAWLMSGRNEATFFEMVTQLAEISAKNRNLELPESAEAGRQVGEMIKEAAKADTCHRGALKRAPFREKSVRRSARLVE